jgi:hypothetical protein
MGNKGIRQQMEEAIEYDTDLDLQWATERMLDLAIGRQERIEEESMGKTKAFWEKTINDRLSQKKVEKLVEDTYQYHVKDMEVDTVEEALKMGIAEGILAAVHILTQDQ